MELSDQDCRFSDVFIDDDIWVEPSNVIDFLKCPLKAIIYPNKI